MPHPGIKDIDPALLLEIPFPPSAFQSQILSIRYTLLTAFQQLVPCPAKIDDLEYKQVFTRWCYHITRDMPIRYGTGMYILHLYIIYWSFCRIHYCPETGNTFSTWSTRPPSIVDFSMLIQFMFYTAVFVLQLANRKSEAYVLVYGSYLVNAAVCTAFWTAWAKDGWLLSGGKMYGKWYALYVPVVYWWAFLVCNRNRMGVWFWEYRQEAQVFIDKADESENAGNPANKRIKKLTKLQTIMENQRKYCVRLVFWTLRIYKLFTPLVVLWLYRYIYQPSTLPLLLLHIDLFNLPGIFYAIFICIVSFLGISVWISYLVSLVDTDISKPKDYMDRKVQDCNIDSNF